MNNKKFPTALAVLLFSGSLLIVSAVIQNTTHLALTSIKTPGVKLEAPTRVSTENDDLQQQTSPKEIQQINNFIDMAGNETSVSKRNTVTPPAVGHLSQSDTVALAASSVRKLFEVDMGKLQMRVILSDTRTSLPWTWAVHFSPYNAKTLEGQGKEFWEYDVLIDPINGMVVNTTAINNSLKRTPISASAASAIYKDASWINTAITILTDKQKESRKIATATLINTETNDKRGMVAVQMMLEDGSSYTAEMRYPDQSLRCLTYETAQVVK
ncbi:hypothetical protein BSK59_06420 [Paenibacillus odorifer]|uniref:hypothetical protein n=1 Tax=Paenibacillus TaxID=44249 RepID=UPI00096F468C|nr:hypothetical protein [Paenibacillus odorifer]OMD19518.1 hypothetical protein BJP48_11125 [Paenibacillus odorifer]OME59894.1 hypothetical protein BSK59_06420 [Paenibacillus odorifer]